MPGTFVGVDLTGSALRPSAYAVLDLAAGVLALGRAATDEELLRLPQRWDSVLVAIDAPLGMPRGLCCLEESCSCAPTGGYKGRLAELALARRGIGCFFTTKRSIIKAVVYRGMRLAREMAAQGFPTIEVYPYATRVVLLGRSLPRKSTALGLARLRERLATLLPTLPPHLHRLDHDLCDALLAAYTAWLHARGRTEVLGIPEEGQIVVPLA